MSPRPNADRFMCRARDLILLVMIESLGCFCQAPPSNTTNLTCQATIPVAPVKSDILLVVDNSSSMTDKQKLLANGLASFAQRLANPAAQQDFQVGVIP